jgi:hypothetical protein
VNRSITLEQLLTSPKAFGLTTASPMQRAVCRIADGLPLGELASCAEVIAAVGSVADLPSEMPRAMLLLSAIRTAKSLIASVVSVRSTQIVDVSGLGPGETPRVSVLSLTTDLGRVVFDHIVGTVMSKPLLKALLVGEPTADTITLRHPTGKPIEIKVVAGARAGASLVARWSAGVVFDEAPRMLGEDDGVVNFDDARRAVLGRLLPGAQLVAIGSPWAPRGPIYEMVQEHWRKPSRELVVIRAPGPVMNPVWWTPERVERLRVSDEQTYRTDVLGEFADPESSLFASSEIEAATRAAPLVLEPEDGHSYRAAIDPATRGNSFALVIVTSKRVAGRVTPRRSVAMVRQWTGSKTSPLSPDAVLREIAGICKRYGVDYAYTDQWSADALRDIALRYDLSLIERPVTATNKVAMFEDMRTRIADGDVELPPDPQLRADLLSIRKRVTTNGIAIELPRTGDGRHADTCPALALALSQAIPDPAVTGPEPGTPEFRRLEEERIEREQQEQWDREQQEARVLGF